MILGKESKKDYQKTSFSYLIIFNLINLELLSIDIE